MQIIRTVTAVTVPCSECSGAMVLERIQPDPEYPILNLHEFRCEICNTTEFVRFKNPRTERPPSRMAKLFALS
jgi:hypothetical protein